MSATDRPLWGSEAREVRDQLQAFVVPLDVAVDVARRVLAEADALDFAHARPIDLAGHLGALTQSLRSVLASIDAEGGR